MPVSTLYELARQRLIKNIDMLNDIGDIPFSFLEPVLRHIQNPAQLQELEENCTQIQGETGDIWLRYIKRDVPNWDQKPHQPRDPRNWSKVYKKLMKDAEKEKLDQENQLKQQMKALQADRDVNKTLIMNTRVGYGARSSNITNFGSGGGRAWGQPAAPAKTGKVAMDKLKRGMFDRNQARTKATHTPQHLLAMRKNTVAQVPERLVRMAQHEAPKTMALSKQAAASAAERAAAPKPPANRQPIIKRPAPQANVAPPRTSLPAGQQFNAPKLKPTAHGVGAASAPKRKREGSSMFQPTKRRM
jgi:elongin-A